MKIQSHFDHGNFNVTDFDRSIDFYRGALDPGKTGEINRILKTNTGG